MKKNLTLFMVIALFIMLFATEAGAVNDDRDLGYCLGITVTDANGEKANTFQIGETINVKLSLAYTGTGKAPIYGLQGKLYFDPYVMRSMVLIENNDVRMQEKGGQITYVFLDMTELGRKDTMMENIGEVRFTAKSSGTVSLYCDNFIVTNKDASQRYIDSSDSVSLVIGTGIKDVTKELLEADIDAAERMLAGCTVTDNRNPGIYYPNFWITTQTEQIFKDAIGRARAVCENDGAAKDEIEAAVADLHAAVQAFEQSKIIGPKRWSGKSNDSDDSDGSDGSDGSHTMVEVSVKGENGKIHPDFVTQKCRYGTSCTIRMLPDEGYETEYVYINGEKFLGSNIFTIPSVSRDTTIWVSFCKKPPFTDVSNFHWFYESVRYAYNKYLFKGTSDTEFSPNLSMTRAMLVTVLYRLEGEPEISPDAVFNDVEKGLWYNDAINWANENNIVKGYGDGIFAPNDAITREQMMVILHRYTMGKGQISGTGSIPAYYTDIPEISDYAVDAMGWAISQGLIRGNTETTLNPKGNATRAEVATILMRYLDLVTGQQN